jgi:hypothetical protein
LFSTGTGNAEQAGTYTIAVAALNSKMGVLINNDDPAAAVVPVCLAGTCGVAGQPEFTLTAFNYVDLGVGGLTTEVDIDNAGNGSFALAATLNTDGTAASSLDGFSTANGTIAGAYADGAYSGTFDVSIVY